MFHLFLPFGQSNLYGYAENAEPMDMEEDERVWVLGYYDCGSTGSVQRVGCRIASLTCLLAEQQHRYTSG